MGDLSNEELLIPFGTYQDMVNRANKYTKENKKTPNIVYLNIKNKNDYIKYSQLEDMGKRINQWKKDNPKEVLYNVWIKKPIESKDILVSVKASATPEVNIKGTKYKLKSFTEFYNLMGSFGYSYYYDDILSLAQEIQALTTGKAMNCTDFAQLGVYIASQFKKDNKNLYQTRYRHVNCKPSATCKSNCGHTQFEITGGEFKKWTVVDISAKASKNSRVYPLGDGWCMDGQLRGYNEPWVLLDKGRS